LLLFFLEIFLDVQVLVLRPFELKKSAVSIYYSMRCIFSKP